jgi:hypothetical protein
MSAGLVQLRSVVQDWAAVQKPATQLSPDEQSLWVWQAQPVWQCGVVDPQAAESSASSNPGRTKWRILGILRLAGAAVKAMRGGLGRMVST